MAHEQSNGANRAVDLSHHLNLKIRSRHPSPLKDIIRLMSMEGMVSLAGLPHPSLFPVHTTSVTSSDPSASTEIELKLSNDQKIPLSAFFQYGTGAGNAQLREWARDFTQLIHQPAYQDFNILLHPGNTNAWGKVVGLLCEEGDYILCESYTYPSAQAYWIPQKNYAAPIAMDGQGIRDHILEETLKAWDTTHPGVRRPHVLYLVSVGSNQAGVTMGPERRRKVYDVCVKYDIIIVEDDPYSFIQYPEQFLSSLAPSFLKYDYQGRVIRLESFSKTLAPGLRLGYFIANSMLAERLLRATEVETQDPPGLSQAVVLSLLQNWGMDGYLTWLQNLRLEYQKRRDWMIDAFAQHFRLVGASETPQLETADGLVALMGDVPVFSFVPPTGGMFIWAKFHLSQNPAFKKMQFDGTVDDPEQAFAGSLWARFAEELVLLTPGSYYHPWQGQDKITTKARGAEPETTHFRFSFSMTTKEEMALGISRLARVVRLSWEV
ncbi:aromatic aminotransferase Aro8 [Aspergillus ellipticus CBS 707.79]|uniref:Aromatic aminotransferase Aro8 n=1 Tax=Aspergillus ellipticus CBS 707.79 TaxID=1448320 RepID=A0A319D396_9EURO|nr:aromatic aminotransferase Aro8 [Aspergillus ellipticus CBS 707.79]